MEGRRPHGEVENEEAEPKRRNLTNFQKAREVTSSFVVAEQRRASRVASLSVSIKGLVWCGVVCVSRSARSAGDRTVSAAVAQPTGFNRGSALTRFGRDRVSRDPAI